MKDTLANKAVIVSNIEGVVCVGNESHNYGARFLKYEVEKFGVNKYCENDFVLFRYADVLYMQYEAALRAGDNTTCAKLLADPEFQRFVPAWDVNLMLRSIWMNCSMSEDVSLHGRCFAVAT